MGNAVAFGDPAVTGIHDLQRMLTGRRIGAEVDVAVLRRDQRVVLRTTPRELPHR